MIATGNSSSTEVDYPGSFIRNGPLQNSNRNRMRLSAGSDATFGTENLTKSMDNAKVPSREIATSRAFIAGHSRAASADISGYTSLVGHSKQHYTNNSPNSIQPYNLNKIDLDRNRNLHHVRNNSVDNSLVTSGCQTFIINSGSQSSIATNTSMTANNKPVIPAKPSGIVSVFVPGSTANLTHSTTTHNKSTGNIYGKINLNSNTQAFNKDFKSIPNQTFVTGSGSELLCVTTTTSPTHKATNSIFPIPPPRKVWQFFSYLSTFQ